MERLAALGQNARRKDAWDKVTGRALYTDDLPAAGMLSARLLTSTHAHARIRRVDTSRALAIPGVLAVLTGRDCPQLVGPLLKDRPVLAQDVVRYAGEPVAMVVAQDEATAKQAAMLIEVECEPLPMVLTPTAALAAGAPLVHEKADNYKKGMSDVYPVGGSNIASQYPVRKGDAAQAFARCKAAIEMRFALPPACHLAMERRSARAQISADGQAQITASSQAPYSVRKQVAEAFSVPEGSIRVCVPFVGGGFGGKAAVMLEMLAYLASLSVGGRPVRLTLSREQDIEAAPVRLGLEAKIKLGADAQGNLLAADITYWLDTGAYADIAPYMTKALAADCTGPYHVENVHCDALCVYTNHSYATSYRGFAHGELTFCIERAMDALARKLGRDPLALRLQNAIRPGSLTPTQVPCTKSLVGDLGQCIGAVRELCGWAGGGPAPVKPDVVRAQGVACFWKTENPPTDAVSGALITCNPDGSVNLHTGVVEMGSDGHTRLAQMLAQKLKISPDEVHVVSSVDTRSAPEHWKTVASLTGYMAGSATVRAADDLIAQLRATGAQALLCPAEDIAVEAGRVFSRSDPRRYIAFKDIMQGYQSGTGESIGEPALGRGGFMLKGLSMLDPITGKGKTGPSWTVGAQVVEIEANLKTCAYRLLNAYTVLDVGKVINPESMRASVAGGMAMGIGAASREGYVYDARGILESPNLRTYKPLHIGQEPIYHVGFVETPDEGSPYGVRGHSEHGLIGMAAALGNALSSAFGTQLTTLPLTPERIWKAQTEA